MSNLLKEAKFACKYFPKSLKVSHFRIKATREEVIIGYTYTTIKSLAIEWIIPMKFKGKLLCRSKFELLLLTRTSFLQHWNLSKKKKLYNK